MAINWGDFENFSEGEFRCRCGCGRADMDETFVDRLQTLRTRLGFPLKITSGFRCPDYNEQVSSSGRNGAHTTGRAADIAVSRGQAYSVLRMATQIGMTGIGVQQKGDGRFLHLDDLLERDIKAPRPTIWSY